MLPVILILRSLDGVEEVELGAALEKVQATVLGFYLVVSDVDVGLVVGLIVDGYHLEELEVAGDGPLAQVIGAEEVCTLRDLVLRNCHHLKHIENLFSKSATLSLIPAVSYLV